MECDNKKKIVSLVLLIVAVLIYFLTEWAIWIPILVLVFAIVGFFCKCKCKTCCPSKTEEVPAVETAEEPEVETEEVPAVETAEEPEVETEEVPVEEEKIIE